MSEEASPGHLGIVELVDVCGELQHRNQVLFERLGGWVSTTPDPPAQQLFAEACHRHAWHAELWAERLPAIGRSPDVSLADEVAGPTGTTERLTEYGDRLADLVELHAALRSRVEAALDPPTARVLDLVDADVAALTERLDTTRPG